MPRLSPHLIRQAASQNYLLPLLLRVCRDLPSARNELRWLQEHARECRRSVTAKIWVEGSHDSWKIKTGGRRTSTSTSLHYSGNPECTRQDEEKTREETEAEPSLSAIRTSRLPIRSRSRRFHRPGSRGKLNSEDMQIRMVLEGNVKQRARGKPLQYILGCQPFGDLDILTRPGVLIPRPETETYTDHVAELLLSALCNAGLESEPHRKKFRILDLCTGSGCIALLLHSILKLPYSRFGSKPLWPADLGLEIIGVDISADAVSLARKNLQHNLSIGLLHPDAAKDVSFKQLDILKLGASILNGEGKADGMQQLLSRPAGPRSDSDLNLDDSWDVIISNPPYISPKDYAPGGKTEASVRKYEPRLALVPVTSPRTHDGDLFYWHLVRLFRTVNARLLAMEVGDSEQATRVHSIIARSFKSKALSSADASVLFECWKDDGSTRTLSKLAVPPTPAPRQPPIKEELQISDRAVLVWSGALAEWRRSSSTVPA